MPVIDVDGLLQLATTFQNEDHREEAELLNRAVDALGALAEGQGSAEDADACLTALLHQTTAHFEREDEAMRRTGFPPFPVHEAEHRRVLGELSRRVEAFRATRDAAALRDYLTRDTVSWFRAHLQSMDFVTAKWLAASEADADTNA